ncbi:MAG: hypothetical protein RRC34_13705 [Lentisphaeria bacterium]|nr:hypothetical protein [Lentisphaeria bacterium]
MRRVYQTFLFLLVSFLFLHGNAAEHLEYKRAPLPPEDNAWTLWEQALEIFEIPGNKDGKELFWDASSWENPLPTGRKADELKAWIETVKPSLDMFDRGVTLGKLQFPPIRFKDPIAHGLSKLRSIAQVKTIQVRFLIQDGHYQQAAELSRRMNKAGRLILDGEGALIHYLVGISIKGMSLEAMCHFADIADVPDQILKEILASLPPARGPVPECAVALKIDYCSMTRPLLDRLQTDINAMEHPMPVDIDSVFSRDESVAFFEKYLRRILRNCGVSWPSRDQKIWEESEKEAGLGDLQGLNMDNVFFDLIMSQQKGAFSETSEWHKLEQLSTKKSNIFGLHLATSTLFALEKAPARGTQLLARRSLTRAYLAIRLYERREKTLPASLMELVAKGYLPEMPADPFSRKPLRYSTTERKIWSVGPEGTNDGRDSNQADDQLTLSL